MVTFSPTSVTVEVPAFYITVNGSTSPINVSNYASLSLVANDIPGHNVEFWYANSDPSTNANVGKNIISETTSVPTNGQYTDSYTVSHDTYQTMTIWIGAYDLTDAVDSNYVKVVVASPVITTVNWWLYSETLGVETKLAGNGASSNTYELNTPAGATNLGVRGQVLDTKGNGINGVTVTITGFATSPVTKSTHTPSLGSPGYFDSGAQTISANNTTSLEKIAISVGVP